MDRTYVFATAAVIVGLGAARIFRRDFDPFAPIWLFLTGYLHVYVIQAVVHRDYAIRARGVDVTTEANLRAFWALLWFLAVYYSGDRPPDRAMAAPGAPRLVARDGDDVGPAVDALGGRQRLARPPAMERARPLRRRRRDEADAPVPDGAARRRHPPDRHGSAALAAEAGADVRGTGRHAFVYLDLDVLRQALALALRDPGRALRLLHPAFQAALIGDDRGLGVRRLPGGGAGDRLADRAQPEPRRRPRRLRLPRLELPSRADPREPQHQGVVPRPRRWIRGGR